MPTDKGRCERDICYAKGNCFNGRDLTNFDERQGQPPRRQDAVANVRVHRTTQRRPRDLFEEERTHRQPLPDEPYVVYRFRQLQGAQGLPRRRRGQLLLRPAVLPNGTQSRFRVCYPCSWCLYSHEYSLCSPTGQIGCPLSESGRRSWARPNIAWGPKACDRAGRQMNLLQICPSFGEPCGVANFAANFQEAARQKGGKVVTVTALCDRLHAIDCDCVLVQHEWGLFPDNDSLVGFCLAHPKPVVLFAHSSGVEVFNDAVSGFLAMNQRMLRSVTKPHVIIDHPAWTPKNLTDRGELKRRYELTARRFVLGSSGLIRPPRAFPEILALLLPTCERARCFVDLVTSRWMYECPEIEGALDSLVAAYPRTFRYSTAFLPVKELNRRLQACDLLWCYTNHPDDAYASGVASDQYASGTRMIVADRSQHAHVLKLPNVVRAPPDLEEFVGVLLRELGQGHFRRHDPKSVSWRRAIDEIIQFLSTITD